MLNDPRDTMLHCDLCILAYQLYHQAVVWPLDPWYEQLAAGMTERRNSFMLAIRTHLTDPKKWTPRNLVALSDTAIGATDLYSGPVEVTGIQRCTVPVSGRGSVDKTALQSNPKLDPVLTNFRQCNPREGSFMGDGKVFLSVKAPEYVVNKIARVYACCYDGWNDHTPEAYANVVLLHKFTGNRNNDLFIFEGATGQVGDLEPAWSPMGYVLKRHHANGYDIHIVYRGSRSGDATRAASQAKFGTPSGNPDWITDLTTELVEDPKLCNIAGTKVAKGFAQAVHRSWGTILKALMWIKADSGGEVPQRITVSGHSLGAALACLLRGAFSFGEKLKDKLSNWFPGWPFATAQGHFLALPPVGNEAYKTAMEGLVRTVAAGPPPVTVKLLEAPYVKGDMIVGVSRSVSGHKVEAVVGGVVRSYTPALVVLPEPTPKNGSENPHEIYLLRRAIGKLLQSKYPAQPNYMVETDRVARPWATHVSFADMLDGIAVSSAEPSSPRPDAVTRANLASVLGNYRFNVQFKVFCDVLRPVMSSSAAWKGFHREETYKQLSENMGIAFGMNATTADEAATQVACLLAYQPLTEWTRRGFRITTELKRKAGGDVALAVDEMLGDKFSLRMGLGLLLAAFQVNTGTGGIAGFERMPELAFCLNVLLPNVEVDQSGSALQQRLSAIRIRGIDFRDTMLHCDLCILAYQLYHQAVVWPLDPWYEQLAAGMTERRNSFMLAIRTHLTDPKKWTPRNLVALSDTAIGATDLYSGPVEVTGIQRCTVPVSGRGSVDKTALQSNPKLDPVLTNFRQCNPHEGSFMGDGKVFLSVKAPEYVVNKIARVYACCYDGWNDHTPEAYANVVLLHKFTGNRNNDLFIFEGATGQVGDLEPAWSPMGYVLKRHHANGYDIHIVYRGSRSGYATRAASQAKFGTPSGNPNWITDLTTELVEDPKLCNIAGTKVAKGFAQAVHRSWGTILKALMWIKADSGDEVPQRITVSGHSLGAALACLLRGAFSFGEKLKDKLSNWFPGWPFATAQGHFLALPPVGNEAYKTAMEGLKTPESGGTTTLIAPYVKDDFIVEVSRSVPGVEKVKALLGGVTSSYTPFLETLPRPDPVNSSENSHEIYLIRRAIGKLLQSKYPAQPNYMVETDRVARPWATHVSFADMLDGIAVSSAEPTSPRPDAVTRANLASVSGNYRFNVQFKVFCDVLRPVMSSSAAWKGFHREETYKQLSENMGIAFGMNATTADEAATQVACLLAYQPLTEWTRRGFRITTELKRKAGGDVALAVDEMLGDKFSLRMGLGLLLAAFQVNTGTGGIAGFERMPELAFCLNVLLPNVEVDQSGSALQQRVSMTTRPSGITIAPK